MNSAPILELSVIKLIALLLGLALLVSVNSACAALPKWVNSPPTSNDILYAIGQGRTKNQAKEVALKNLLGQINTTVSAEFEQKQVLSNNVFNERIQQTINSTIEELPISGYQEIKNHSEKDTFYSLISITKLQFQNTFKQEIDSNLAIARQIIKRKGTTGTELEWWFSNRNELVKLHGKNLRLLNALGLLEAESSRKSKLVANYENDLIQFEKTNCLYAEPHKQKAIQFAFREQIVANGIMADNKSCIYSLSVVDTVETRKLFGQHTASLTLEVSLLKNGIPLNSELIVETGTSMRNPNSATKGAYKRLVKMIKNDNGNTLHQLLTN